MKKIKIWLIFFVLIINGKLYSQQWFQMGNGFTSQFKGFVMEISNYNNKIIAGGYFKKSGNLILNGIAQWDGSGWQKMSRGIWWNDGASPDSVGNGGGGLAEYKGYFYSSGAMYGAGGGYIGQPSHYAYNITRWNGTDWFPLSPPPPYAGFGGSCWALQVYHNNLFCGGFFDHTYDSSGIVVRRGITRWNDTVFSDVGQLSGDFPPNNEYGIMDFCIYHNALIAGGFFTSINGSPFGSYSGIGAYNDTVWSALGTGFNNAVFSVAVLDDTLYAAGRFTATRGGGTALPRVAKWDGTNWLPVGEGLNDSIWKLYADTLNHKLYAGGFFTQTGNGQPAKHLAVWDGVSWQEVGNGTDSAVYALYIKDSNLYVGGKFTHVGNGIPANRIAVWGVTNPNGVREINVQQEEVEIYPNPSGGMVTVISNKYKVESIKIYNVLGECVMSPPLQRGREGLIDMSGFAKGIYFMRIEDENKNVMNRKIIKN